MGPGIDILRTPDENAQLAARPISASLCGSALWRYTEKLMMTPREFAEKFSYVRKRHNSRQLVVIIISFSILFGGLLSINNFRLSDFGRHIYVYCTAAIFAVVGIVGCVINYQQDKKDCYNNSITCPHCGKHLYDWHRLILGGESPVMTGKCGHCKGSLAERNNVSR
jgi:hypothetical protein